MAAAGTGADRPERIAGPLLERLRLAVTATATTAAPMRGQRRAAAVLLLFDPSSERLPLLFVLRSEALRLHAGQIAFPGGGQEAQDADAAATALREAHEEVGLEPGNVEVIGSLTPLITAVSDRWVTPVIGLQRSPWTVRADGIEVAEWFRIDLATLLEAPHAVRELERDGPRRLVHFYEVGPRVIWGASAAILHELLERLRPSH